MLETTEAAVNAAMLSAALTRADQCIAMLAGPELQHVFVNEAYAALAPGRQLSGLAYGQLQALASALPPQCLRRVMETGQAWVLDDRPGAAWQGQALRLPDDPQGRGVVGLFLRRRRPALDAGPAEELGRLNARLEKTLDSITDGVLVMDRQWRYTYVSPQAGRIVNMAPADLLGRVVWELFPDAVGTAFERFYHQAMASGRAVHFEEFYPAPLNQWMECRCFPEPEGLTVYFRDVTARRRAEEDLREKTLLLTAISDSTPDVIFAKDRQGRLRFANPATLALVGKPAAEVLGRTDAEILADARAASEVMANDRRIMDTGCAEDVEEHVPLASGEPRVWHSRKLPYRDAAGEVAGLLGVSRDITERKRMADESAELRRKLASALLAAEMGTFEWHVPEDRLWGDENFLRIFGVAPGESADPLGLPLAHYFDKIHPDDRSRVAEDIERVLLHGEPYETEYRICADGDLRWVIARGRGEPGPDGKVARFPGAVVDITARKQAEAALLERAEQASRAERQLALAMRAGRSGTFEWDAQSNRNRWSPELLALYGLTPEEFGGRAEDWIAAVVPEDRALAQQAIDTALATGDFRCDFRIRRRSDGDIRWLHGRAEVSFDAAGRPSQMVGLNVDMTERRLAEAAVSASERRFQEVLGSSPIGLALLAPVRDAAGRVTDFAWRYLNRAAQRALARPLEALIGQRVGEVLPDAWHEPGLFNAFVLALESGRTQMVEVATTSLGFDGIYLNVASPHEDGLVVWFVDITESKRMEAHLRETDRRKDVFLATLSHELRNPLAPIRTAASILGNPAADSTQLAFARAVIQRQTAHMALLLDDLLDLARITQGKLVLSRARVRLTEVVDSALEAVQPQIGSRRHRLTVALPDTPVWLDADAVRLAQVLSNLLTNAAKYTDPGGDIGLSAHLDGQTLVIRVSDNGIGIPRQALPRLFQMFSQIEGTGGRSEGGLGIGLALVHGLVSLHGGTVSVHSDGPGRGSAFEVRLSAQPEGAMPAADHAAERLPAPAPAQRRVLIADDNQDAADALQALLELDGHAVRVAHDGQAALTLAQAFRPELAILDIGMPDMNGHEVAQAIRQQGWGRDMVLIAVTGFGTAADRQRTAEAGFDHHLTKPVDPQRLVELLASDRPQA